MASEFRLPDIGEGLTEAEVVRWHVSVGDTVVLDQPLVEVETDKAVVELPSPFAGTVLHRGAAEGETLRVGEIVVVVGDPGERWADGQGQQAAAAQDGDGGTRSDAGAPIVGTLSEEARDLTPGVRAAGGGSQRPPALPLVRKLAKELGVDLRAVPGTGPGGRVTRADVAAAAARAARQPAPSATGPGERPAAARTGDERRPLGRLRRTIAANLRSAWSEIPQVTAFDEVDATRLLAARKALGARHGVPVPIDALVVAAVIPALRAHPELNSSLDGDTLVLHARQDIGIAVDTPDGLVVAVVADAGSKDLLQLAGEVQRLGAGARARTLSPAELSGQTFTVSNIGALGGGWGTPLVPKGTVAILSVGRVAPRPVVRDSRVEAAPVMQLSLSYDHRVVDGGAGRRFLATVIEYLTEPVLFLT
ncbi:MAG TPA: dihydrolipoamide acetyltransferase family protein [Actinomycetes bacterium]